MSDDIQSAIDAGQEIAGIQKANDWQAWVHKDMMPVAIEPVPRDHRSKATIDSIDDLIAYTKRYAREGFAHAFFSGSSGAFSILVVLTHDAVEDGFPFDSRKASWKASHKSDLSRQLTVWKTREKNWLSQADFADLLDLNSLDIYDPSAADVMEMVTNFTVKRDVAFSSVIRLNDGTTAATYEETDKNLHKKAEMIFPAGMTLSIPLYKNGEPRQIPLKLRYKLTDGKLLLFQYLFVGLDQALDAYAKFVIEKITKETGIPVYLGNVIE